MNREAQILAAMSKASLAEQRMLAQELEAIRAARRTALRAEQEVSLADAVIRDTLTPVVALTAHTAATDWMGEITPEHDERQLHVQARAEATVWTNRVPDFVKEDRGEFTEQATGFARKWASQFGFQATAAREAFLAQAMHLAGFRRVASGEGAPEYISQAKPGDFVRMFASEPLREIERIEFDGTNGQGVLFYRVYFVGGGMMTMSTADSLDLVRRTAGADGHLHMGSIRRQADDGFADKVEAESPDTERPFGWDETTEGYNMEADELGLSAGAARTAASDRGEVDCPDCGGAGTYLSSSPFGDEYRCSSCGFDFTADDYSNNDPVAFGGPGHLNRTAASDGAVSIADENGTIVYTQVFPDEAAEIIAANPGWYIVDGTGSRKTAAGSYAQYGWIVDTSYIEDDDVDDWGNPVAVTVLGPSNIHPKVEQYLKSGKGKAFKLYDDDDELYYSGRWVENAVAVGLMTKDESEGDYGGNPLEDFGTPSAGAAYMTDGRGGRGNSIIGSRKQAGPLSPGAGAEIYRNDAGEVTGWDDYPDGYGDDGYDDDYDRGDAAGDAEWEDGYEAGQSDFESHGEQRLTWVRGEYIYNDFMEVDQTWVNGYIEGWMNAGGDESAVAHLLSKKSARQGSVRKTALTVDEVDKAWEKLSDSFSDSGISKLKMNEINSWADSQSGYPDWDSDEPAELEKQMRSITLMQKQVGKRTGSVRKTAARSLSEIAYEISRDWRPVDYSAAPYLSAMMSLNSMSDMYGADSARTIVAYFISNSGKWRTEKAKEIKAELKAMMKSKSSAKTASSEVDMVKAFVSESWDGLYTTNFWMEDGDGRWYRSTLRSPDGQEVWTLVGSDGAMSDMTRTASKSSARHAAQYHLFDYATADKIGPATDEQIEASLASGDDGAILIDAEGDVVAQGAWGAQQPGVRTVYVASLSRRTASKTNHVGS